MNMVESLKDKADGLLSSASEINRVLVDKLEQGNRINIDSATYYSNVGIKQLRALGNIRDFDSVQKFTANSISQSGEVIKKMLEDSKSWMSLLGDTKEQLTSVIKSNAQNAASEVSEMADSKKKSVKSVMV
jgi:phasin family protein